jgi:plastocyanin
MRSKSGRLVPMTVLVLAACGGGDGGTTPPPPGVELGSIVASAATMALSAGQSQTISMTARDVNNNPIATASGYTFTSANPSIAIVNSSGLVTALSAGTVQITVSLTLNGKSATASVSVTVSGALPSALTVAAGGNTNDFTPASAAIARAGTVTYTFGARVHNVAFGGAAGAPQDIGNVSNTTVARQFNNAGSFNYTCTLHQGMNGLMLVP